jgi:hypothetical protein
LGQPKADDSFRAWLSKNSPQLGSLILSSFSGNHVSAIEVLRALAEAGQAAQAAGAPLALHTLRVFAAGEAAGPTTVGMDLSGRLLACLPHLRCLQLQLGWRCDLGLPCERLGGEVQAALRPLQQATQLQELYLTGPYSRRHSQERTLAVAGLLPPTLKRLSWKTPPTWKRKTDTDMSAPDLSHLTGLTFLHLCNWEGVASAKLPPRLQQLELHDIVASPEVLLEEQQEVVVGWSPTTFRDVQQRLGDLTALKRLSLDMNALAMPAVRTALAQHTRLSDLALCNVHENFPAALATAGSISSLRSLTVALHLWRVPVPPSLAALTGLTRLALSMSVMYSSGGSADHPAWAEEIGRMTGLRWLAVPQGLLGAEWGPLAGLQQLRVLVVSSFAVAVAVNTSSIQHLVEGWSQRGLPPRLQLLSIRGVSAEQAATEQIRRLRQLLRGSGCELVVGVDLDEVCDPAQQLAGLPLGLQQVLA